METLCVEENCNRKVRSRGRCSTHYEYWRKTNRDQVRPAPSRWNNSDGSRMVCMKPGCTRPIETQGLCTHHYQNMHYESTRGMNKSRKNRKITDYDGTKREMICAFPGCGRPEFNPGLCAGHYYQNLRGEGLRPLHETAPCPVPGCRDTYWVKRSKSGVCRAHQALGTKYGLDREGLIDLYTDARCRNPGCGSTDNLHVDHDHSCCNRSGSCGKCVRGLLCAKCNTALGYLYEDPERIAGLIKYLGG